MHIRFIYIFVILISLSDIGFAAQKSVLQLVPREELECAKDAYRLIRKRDLSAALLVAKFCGVEEVQQMVYWYAASNSISSEESFAADFFMELEEFPDHEKLLRNLEKDIVLENNYKNILLFFGDKYPHTKDGYAAFIDAISQVKKDEYVKEQIENATKYYFLSNSFNVSDMSKFIKRYPDVIDQDLVHEKISKLIWSKNYSKAKRILNYANEDYRKLFKARLAFVKNSSRASRYLKNVPKSLSSDEGLFYGIVKWLEKQDRDGRVTKYLLNVKESSYPVKWFGSRIRNSRYLIKKEEYKTAYKIIANHQISAGGYEYAESEWFAGWIALRFLDKPDIAVQHFRNVYDNVGFAISLSRASYWLGRAYAADGREGLAAKWYNVAGSYSTTYYGQMAILEMKQEVMINLPEFKEIPIGDLKQFVAKEKLLKLALYYAYVGDIRNATKFFTYYIKNNKDSELQRRVVMLATYTGDYALINKIARYAARFNLITLENYPLMKNVNGDDVKQSALIMSIIKQESGFNAMAVSRVGAIGFMQIMPPTAKEMARRMKIPYSSKKLRKDADYNIKLGTYYMNHLLKRFDNSYILAIASYNAGPTNTKRWIRENGDPRSLKDVHQIIDWVEKVTFSETRNYIQRIMETSVIYLHLIKQTQLELTNTRIE